MQISIEYGILAILWIFWCFLHSAMISESVTRFVKRNTGKNFKFYRLFYNIVSFTTIAIPYFYGRTVHSPILVQWNGAYQLLRYSLILLSLYLFYTGSKNYKFSQFIGIRQIKTNKSTSVISESDTFNTAGILKLVRHPWYLASVIIVWSYTGVYHTTTIITSLILTFYLFIGAFIEEKKLINQFGETYLQYQSQVSMFLPFKWLKNILWK